MCASVLADHGADLHAKNGEGRTALHLAAELGLVSMASWLLIRTKGRRPESPLAKVEDKNGLKALDVAVEQNQFPPGDLYIFTDGLDESDQVQMFLQIAKSCPSAASELLRTRDASHGRTDLSLVPIDKKWKRVLHAGARGLVSAKDEPQLGTEITMMPKGQHRERGGSEGCITVRVLADLVHDSPQAAVDVLQALTVVPTVEDRQHNPLPVRAVVPAANELCPLIACYEQDRRWLWSKKFHTKRHGMKRWQTELAAKD
eukprot:5921727-Amphidinium_carterae.1